MRILIVFLLANLDTSSVWLVYYTYSLRPDRVFFFFQDTFNQEQFTYKWQLENLKNSIIVEVFFVVVVFFLVTFFFFKLEFSRCMCNALLLGSVVVQLGFLFFGRTSCCLFKESYSCHVKHNNLFVCLWRCAASSPNAPICCAAYLFGVRSLLRSKI